VKDNYIQCYSKSGNGESLMAQAIFSLSRIRIPGPYLIEKSAARP
jgi:hypothetical protein